ncbi:MAG TPA: PQQ-binding-like beta-propeller repeat protein, partial [Actinopolymorphaceae bacterium]
MVVGLGVGGYFLYTTTSPSDAPESTNVATEGKSEKKTERDRPTAKATPKPAAGEPLWVQRVPDGAPDGEMTRVIGTWVSDTVVVRGQHDSVVAYNLENGKVAWELPKEGVGFCAMSTKTREGLGYVTYGQLTGAEDIRCNRIQAVELATGASRWTAEIIEDSEQYPPTETDAKRPEIFGDAVVAYAGRKSFKAFDAAKGGSPRWTFDGIANNPVKVDSEGECTAQDWSGSQESLYVVAACAPERFAFGKEQTVVFALDPGNGKPRWTTPVP